MEGVGGSHSERERERESWRYLREWFPFPSSYCAASREEGYKRVTETHRSGLDHRKRKGEHCTVENATSARKSSLETTRLRILENGDINKV